MQVHLKKIIMISLGICVALLVWRIFLRVDGPAYREPTAGRSIVAFGDSLVEGVGASPSHGFAALLSERLGVVIANAGRSGDSTASALLRMDEALWPLEPRIVIVLLGGNDALARVPALDVERNLSQIIDRIHARGAAVLLLGVRSGAFGSPYDKAFEKLAKEKQVRYVPDVLKGVFGHGDLMADTIHPNDKGYAKIADRVEPVLRDMLDL